MTALGTITPVAPLDASDDSYLSFSVDLAETLSTVWNDTPADFGNMNSLSWQVEYSLVAARTDDTYGLNIRIVNGATILAAADAGGRCQGLQGDTSPH